MLIFLIIFLFIVSCDSVDSGKKYESSLSALEESNEAVKLSCSFPKDIQKKLIAGQVKKTNPWKISKSLALTQAQTEIEDVEGKASELNEHAKQCVEKLGPIPDFNCQHPTSNEILIPASGGYRTFTPPPQAGENMVFMNQFCDFPAWTGLGVGGTCNTGSRAGVIKREKTQWVYICRNQWDVAPDEVNFDFVGLIGVRETGESCYFNTRAGVTLDDQAETIANLPNPLGSDEQSKTQAVQAWMAPSEMEVCTECHSGWPIIRSWFVKDALRDFSTAFDIKQDFTIASQVQAEAGFHYHPMSQVPKAPDGNACDDCHKLPGKGDFCKTMIESATGLRHFGEKGIYSTESLPLEGPRLDARFMPPLGAFNGAYDNEGDWTTNWFDHVTQLTLNCR